MTVEGAAAAAHAGWISVLPPVVALVVALVFRNVIVALVLGVWVGAWCVAGPGIDTLGSSILDTMQIYVRDALADPDHVSVILFSLMIGGMVGIISRNGGMHGVVALLTRHTTTPRSAQFATTGLGLAIFFDDYSNTMVVGNTMRPLTDRLRVSREKLAYLVDTTAAPVACIGVVTTWIGYQVGLIQDAIEALPGVDESAYLLFLRSIPYSFYPWLAIVFMLLLVAMQRDFGPMLAAERRARLRGDVSRPGARMGAAAGGEELEPVAGRPTRARNAVVPVLVLIAGVAAGLWLTGRAALDAGAPATVGDIIGAADSYKALVWSSFVAVLVAGAMTVTQRLMSIDETVEAWYVGVRAMLFAMIVLTLAWALAATVEALGTADYIVSVLSDALPPGVFPALVFVVAACTAFATGTSWGTMGILMPLVVPLVWSVITTAGFDDAGAHHVLHASVAAVLAGAVWGDHCSPISDTTILSSTASSCDHIDHVRTQLPYAMIVGGVAIVFCLLPVGFGLPWWAGLIAGATALALVARLVGRPVP
ncbi:MAG TPA: Na+/H+ antiporter NhaC family protein [Steroidobacteraceae bacterium]|nr:Na+/H+ antiporter NhaC family protein [Steroidobacteraceae bacterium]